MNRNRSRDPELRLGAACIGCAWDHADTPWAMVSGIEIHTGNFAATGTLFTPKAIARWDALADDGFRLAAIGGSDDHRAGGDPGAAAALIGSPTTMVLADDLSEASLIAAVRAGRTQVKLRGPEAPAVELTAIDPADATRRAGLGDTLDGSAAVRFEVAAPGGDGTTAELWRDGALVATSPVVGGAATFERDVTGEVERYRVELTDPEGRLVVTSHLYVHGTPAAADDGCGCASGAGTGAVPGVALVLLGLAARRRRR